MRLPSTWSPVLGVVGMLSTMPIATIASLFPQTHYTRHDQEKADGNARPPREIDEHPQARLTEPDGGTTSPENLR